MSSKTTPVATTLLNDNEEAFCRAYVETNNAALSFRMAYDPANGRTRNRHVENAYHLLNRDDIKNRIGEIKLTLNNAGLVSLSDVMRRWALIATADVDELIGLRVGCCRHCYGADNMYQWRTSEYLKACKDAERAIAKGAEGVELPDIQGGVGYDHTRPPRDDCDHCRGEGVQRIVARDTSKLSPQAALLYNGVKRTRNGIEVLIADRAEALDRVTRMLGGYKDEVGAVNIGQINVQNNDFKGTLAEATEVYQKLIKG